MLPDIPTLLCTKNNSTSFILSHCKIQPKLQSWQAKWDHFELVVGLKKILGIKGHSSATYNTFANKPNRKNMAILMVYQPDRHPNTVNKLLKSDPFTTSAIQTLLSVLCLCILDLSHVFKRPAGDLQEDSLQIVWTYWTRFFSVSGIFVTADRMLSKHDISSSSKITSKTLTWPGSISLNCLMMLELWLKIVTISFALAKMAWLSIWE